MWSQNYPSWKHSHSALTTRHAKFFMFSLGVVVELSVTAANRNHLALLAYIQHLRSAPDTPTSHGDHLLFCSVLKLGVIPAKEYERCTRAEFPGERRVTTAQPESIRTVHFLTARYWKCWCFQSVCSSRTLCPSSQQQSRSRHLWPAVPPHRAKHAHQPRWSSLSPYYSYRSLTKSPTFKQREFFVPLESPQTLLASVNS
jgi:hypothetical protein